MDPPDRRPLNQLIPSVFLAVLLLAWAGDYLGLVRFRDGFTWMDPYQYYGFARDMLGGTRPWNGFEVASIFPYFLLPSMALGGGTVPAALAGQVGITLGLVLALAWLGRELGWARGYGWLTALLWLGAPLALGLAHELYSETALTLLVVLTLAAAWRAVFGGGVGWITLASALWALTLMFKITAPVFLAGPLAVLALAALRERSRRERLLALAGGYFLAAAAVVALQFTLFSASWDYWRSLGNTTIPIMRLIGPVEVWSWGSLIYYPFALLNLAIPGGVLGFLALVLASVIGWSLSVPPRSGGPVVPRPGWGLLYLLAWVGVPLVVFTLQAVKEPRHILPILPALILLLVSGLLRLSGLGRSVVVALVGLLALGQYVAATRPNLISWQQQEIPYLTLGASGMPAAAELITRELLPDLIGAPAGPNVPALETWARFNLDVAYSGLPANEALALAWAIRPGILHQADFPEDLRDPPFDKFEDPYVYSAFNYYNARCGYPVRYQWWGSMEDVETQAWVRPEFPILQDLGMVNPRVFSSAFPLEPHFKEVTIPRPGNPRGALLISLYRRPMERESSRQTYPKSFLSPRDPLTTTTALAALRRAHILRQDWERLDQLSQRHPGILDPNFAPGRNIYWFGFYQALDPIEAELLRQSPLPPGP